MLLHINVDMSDAEHPVHRTSLQCILKYRIYKKQVQKQVFEKVYFYFRFFFFTEVGIGDNLGVSRHQNV